MAFGRQTTLLRAPMVSELRTIMLSMGTESLEFNTHRQYSIDGTHSVAVEHIRFSTAIAELWTVHVHGIVQQIVFWGSTTTFMYYISFLWPSTVLASCS